MMAVMFAADMVLDCKQRGIQTYVHWHGPRSAHYAPRLPKTKCRIMQEFLPLISIGMGTLIHLDKTDEEDTGVRSGQEAQQLKRSGYSIDDQNQKKATPASPHQVTGSRKRPLSAKDKVDRHRRQNSDFSKTRQPDWGGMQTSRASQAQEDRSNWTPQLRPQESGRHRSREPRGKLREHSTRWRSRQREAHHKAQSARASYSPRSRHSDIRLKETLPSKGKN